MCFLMSLVHGVCLGPGKKCVAVLRLQCCCSRSLCMGHAQRAKCAALSAICYKQVGCLRSRPAANYKGTQSLRESYSHTCASCNCVLHVCCCNAAQQRKAARGLRNVTFLNLGVSGRTKLHQLLDASATLSIGRQMWSLASWCLQHVLLLITHVHQLQCADLNTQPTCRCCSWHGASCNLCPLILRLPVLLLCCCSS